MWFIYCSKTFSSVTRNLSNALRSGPACTYISPRSSVLVIWKLRVIANPCATISFSPHAVSKKSDPTEGVWNSSDLTATSCPLGSSWTVEAEIYIGCNFLTQYSTCTLTFWLQGAQEREFLHKFSVQNIYIQCLLNYLLICHNNVIWLIGIDLISYIIDIAFR